MSHRHSSSGTNGRGPHGLQGPDACATPAWGHGWLVLRVQLLVGGTQVRPRGLVQVGIWVLGEPAHAEGSGYKATGICRTSTLTPHPPRMLLRLAQAHTCSALKSPRQPVSRAHLWITSTVCQLASSGLIGVRAGWRPAAFMRAPAHASALRCTGYARSCAHSWRSNQALPMRPRWPSRRSSEATWRPLRLPRFVFERGEWAGLPLKRSRGQGGVGSDAAQGFQRASAGAVMLHVQEGIEGAGTCCSELHPTQALAPCVVSRLCQTTSRQSIARLSAPKASPGAV